MEEFYRGQINAGEFREIDPAVLARAVHGMVIGLTLLRGMEGETGPLSRIPPEKLSDDLLSLLLYGMLKDKDSKNPDSRRK